MTQPTTPESGTPITDVAYLALDDECNQLKRDLTAALGREAKLRGEYSSTQKSLEDMHTRAESREASLREELEEAQRMIKNLAPTGRYNGKDIERWYQESARLADELRAARACIREAANEFEKLSKWREAAHDYDRDVGHAPRTFCEDVSMIERHAAVALGRLAPAIAASEKEPR